MDTNQSHLSRSGSAIAGLVLGIVAALFSVLPIINNVAFIFGILGFIFGIVGVVGCKRGKKRGFGLAVAAVIVNIAACGLVLASQAAMSSALDEAINGPGVSSVQANGSSQGEDKKAQDKAQDDTATENLAMGTTVTLDDGLTVSVDEIQTGLTFDFLDGTYSRVRVTYTNQGDKTASFNPYNWKAEDAQGVIRDTTYVTNASEELNSGDLAAGGSVSGNIYFEGDVSRILYYASVLSDTHSASWKLS